MYVINVKDEARDKKFMLKKVTFRIDIRQKSFYLHALRDITPLFPYAL